MKLRYSIVLAISLAACSSTKRVEIKEPADPSLVRAAARDAAIDEMMRNFQRVHFAFDSAQISERTRDALAANVDIMRRFEEIELEVQGHCDEQGSTEYNLALGDRRADAIRKYMVTAGVDAHRVSTISFGEEKPLFEGTNEDAYRANRRAEFRVTIDPLGVARGTVGEIADTAPAAESSIASAE
jgi:peptidoglycan-associated lipoprotein